MPSPRPLLHYLIAPLACLLAGTAASASALAPLPLPLTQNGGVWNAGHVQGIAVDRRHGFIYYSFTTLLAKYDFKGHLIGTLTGWTGHLGDLDFNESDGKVYGSLEYKKNQGFYIAILDVDRIDHVGMVAGESDIIRTVYLPEVFKDYSEDVNGDGVFDGDDGKYRDDVIASPDHRYDCSGIDGLAFGPAFGHSDGKTYLTVAYGIYGNTRRGDNDHQVLLQYDIADWARYAAPLSESALTATGRSSLRANISCGPATHLTVSRTCPTIRRCGAGFWASIRAASRLFPTICSSPSRRARAPRCARWSACLHPMARAGNRA
jgi:hypothetical protein